MISDRALLYGEQQAWRQQKPDARPTCLVRQGRTAAGATSHLGPGKHMHQIRQDSKFGTRTSRCMPLLTPCVVQTAGFMQCTSCLAQFPASSSCRLSAQCTAQPSWASSSACNAITQRCLARRLDMAVHSFRQASVFLYKHHTISTHLESAIGSTPAEPQTEQELHRRASAAVHFPLCCTKVTFSLLRSSTSNQAVLPKYGGQ